MLNKPQWISPWMGRAGFIKRWLTSFPISRRVVWKIRKFRRPPQHSASLRSIAPDRWPGQAGKRILFLEDRVPHAYLGRGYPRSNRILWDMVHLGYFVTFYPSLLRREEPGGIYQDIPKEVEVMLDYGSLGLQDFLQERKGFYDLIFVSRPHNMAMLKPFLNSKSDLLRGCKIVYDAESLFCLRELARLRLCGQPVTEEDARQKIGAEVRLTDGCHSVVCVSDLESRQFREHGAEHVHTLSYALEAAPTRATFEEREDILFVGSLESGSPNADSVLWFIREVLPILQSELARPVRFLIAGANEDKQIEMLAGESVQVLGKVDDLSGVYRGARVFVAPTRFAAGLPLKVLEAAAHGLPVVTTSLIAHQLGWRHESELLVADSAHAFAAACRQLCEDAELWRHLRINALERIQTDYAPENFAARLGRILQETLNAGRSVSG